LLNQAEVLNAVCKDRRESSLNISLKEVLAANTVNETAVINNERDKVSEY